MSDDSSDDRPTTSDPFDQFDDYRDREGNPFASLDENATDDSTPDSPADESPGPAVGEGDATGDPLEQGPNGGDPFEYGDDATPSASDASTTLDEADPFAGVDVPDGDPFEASGGAFEQAGVEGIDPDSVWDRLTGDADEESGATGEDGTDHGDDPDVVEVSKHSYCEGCPHFSAPPDVACGHEGTEILEFVDVDTVRIANCPVVEERRELEEDV